MKKSILSFGGIMMLFLLVFSCTEEQENINNTDEQINLKGKVNKESDVAYRTDNFNVIDLLISQQNYIHERLTKKVNSYNAPPERKDTDWFNKHLSSYFKEDTETNKWVINNINSNKILIFGTSIEDVELGFLVFSDGLTLPKEFEFTSGIIIDTKNMYEGCPKGYCQMGNNPKHGNINCRCVTFTCCSWELKHCWDNCPKPAESFDQLDKFFPDKWGWDFKKLIRTPLHTIKIGDKVLQIKLS